MNNLKILFVCTQVMPYTSENEVSNIVFEIAKMLNAAGAQVRLFIPKYGSINERRHQLHEVIRLSGMNLVVNDIDMPLIIKVASVPKERIQVYFIENEDYFKRNQITFDDNGNIFSDNDERSIFFAKGTIETIKKLNWTPDIIHIQGWPGMLLPLYLKTFYKDESIFSQSKLITSIFDDEFEGTLGKNIHSKLAFDDIVKDDIPNLAKFNFENLLKTAIQHSDAVSVFSKEPSKKMLDFIKKNKKKSIICSEEEKFVKEHLDFYKTI